MAPANSAAKNLQGSRPRPTVIRSVVPALPIQYMQKRKQHVEKIRAEEPAQPPAPALTNDTEQPAIPPSEPVPVITNGSPVADEPEQPELNTMADASEIPIAPAATEEDKGAEKEVTKELEVVEQEPVPEAAIEETRSASPEARSSASRSTYQMPPAFYPGSQNNYNSQDAIRPIAQPAMNGQHPIHNTQPSTSSLVFGGYAESNNSSPAPPSTGYMQPYGYHPPGLQNGRPNSSVNGHLNQNMSNGFSPMGPPPPGYYRQDNNMHQNHNMDSYARRQMVSFAPPDGYSPSETPVGADAPRFPPFDPSTPHSFHGSQSSVPNEQDFSGPPFYGQHPTAAISNGSNGHIDEVRLYQQSRPKPRLSSQSMAPQVQYPVTNQPLFPPPGMDNLDGLVSYILAQFGDPTMADYSLELRYADDRAEPVRIPGHNLIFARSPTLKGFMTALARDNNTDGLSMRTLLIETADRYLRSDAFWMAVQRLYGGPLLDIGALGAMQPSSAAQSAPNMPGSPVDRFDLALGYAAAGTILQIPPVINRGIEIACHFVNWITLEKALEFALDGGLDSQWTLEGAQTSDGRSPSTYGPAVNMLIHSALTFIITSFPPNFELDTSVEDSSHLRRIPIVPTDRQNAQNSRLSYIKFGDHSTEDPAKPTASNTTNATLSKILLNLPFQLLKYVLESQRLGNVNAWATTALRQKVMHAVTEEREIRRQKAYSSPHVSTIERTANGRQWEVVGWQEGLAYAGSQVPSLVRTWVDFTVPSHGS